MRQIRPPANFFHVDQIPASVVARDPRVTTLDEFAVDLRMCDFLRPPAILWTLTYCLLAARRGTSCHVMVPKHVGVAKYLKAARLFDLLKEHGVSVDDHDIEPAQQGRIVVPIRRLEGQSDVERIANDALSSLADQNLGAVNQRILVTETLTELAGNAVEHGNSPIGCYGMVQYYDWQEGPRFLCVVADGGVGIRQSLMKNPDLGLDLSTDWDAIEIAMQERVTGTGHPHRGKGLFEVSQEMRKPGSELLIHSGLGIVPREDPQMRAREGALFPGTLAYATVRT
ncbi:MAG: hypothetical protein OXI03_04480 [Chloroflexota bacterium]|nr:hypothetical protein [Chloroflexota bacterium]